MINCNGSVRLRRRIVSSIRWTFAGIAALSILLAVPVNAAKNKSGSSTDDPGCKSCMSQAANLFASNQIKPALELLSTWSPKCPRNAQLHLLYSTILIREGKDLAGAEREAQLAVVARPDSQGAHLQCGMTLMSNGKYQQAAVEFKTVTDLNPASYEAWSALADLYKRLREDELASAATTRAANLEPGTRTVRLAVLTNLKRSGNFPRAKKELQRLLKDGAFGPEFDQSLAEEALQIGAYEEAVEGATRASAAYPKSAQPLKILAVAQYLGHQHPAALATTEKLLSVSPGNPEGLALKSLALFGLGKNTEASAAAVQAETADASGLSLVAAGASRLAAGDYAKAVEAWKACATTGPRSSASERLPETLAHLHLFRFYHEQNAMDDAVQEARSISADPRFKASALGAQAQCLFEEATRPEELAQADRLLKESIDVAQSIPESLLAQAASQLKAGSFEQSRQSAAKAAVIEPALSDAIAMLARIAEAEGKTEEASQLVQKGLDGAPKDPGLLCIKGRLLVKANKAEEAIKLLTPLVAEPAAPGALLVLGESYEKTGAADEALKCYKQSLEGLGAGSANMARAAIKRLESKPK